MLDGKIAYVHNNVEHILELLSLIIIAKKFID